LLKEFKAFILRGNVIDLAVGVIIGAAFAAVVTSLVKNVFTPIIGLPGSADFNNLVITLKHGSRNADGTVTGGSVLRYGAFLTDLLNFVLIAAAVFFCIVKPVNALQKRRARGEEPQSEEPAAKPDDVVLLEQIRDLLAGGAMPPARGGRSG
jgi:large conductance mechanosensitive channel